ncbi:MAG: hypothetical protein M1834_005620 [Cirrosporium novae-zelandiae]|nr:MAG: hypothetical protein M1834_005620 [Cirrosporium novae-zelandiae]
MDSTSPPPYSVPQEAASLFHDGILKNLLMANVLPPHLQELGKLVRFKGNALPSIPINWRLAESISALKALEATMVNWILERKYRREPVEVVIDTDHASLFFMSAPLARILDKDGTESPITTTNPKTLKMFPNGDKHRSCDSTHRMLATGIYKTRDGRFYHVHGSMNPDPTLTALGLPLEGEPSDTYEMVVERVQSKVSQFDSTTLDSLLNDQYHQAGTIAWSSSEYFSSPHGQQNGKIGLYELIPDPHSSQPASWWPDHPSLPPSSPKRPLAGLKVVDLTRIIAGPTITRGLAELGASVMRVTSPQVTDFTTVHHELNWGKWNCSLHLKDNEGDREKLRGLIREADVVVDGYRPGVMEKLGFGREDVFKLCCGVSLAYGQAMGVDEAVTPPFPNSDHCTGVIGTTAILHALIERASQGGSYGVDVSLNYYSQWLARTCGTYPPALWTTLHSSHSSPLFHHYHNTRYTLPAMLKFLHQYDEDVLFKEEFFEKRWSGAVGAMFLIVKPVARYGGGGGEEGVEGEGESDTGVVELGFQVGTRGNGVDEPEWPDDLTAEIVS